MAKKMNKKILVAEDNELILASTVFMLRENGYSVKTAISGYQALDALKEEDFDMLLTDFLMYGMNGVQLIQKIREDGNSMKIFMMSATPELIIAKELKSLKILAILRKPFSQQQLLDVLSCNYE